MRYISVQESTAIRFEDRRKTDCGDEKRTKKIRDSFFFLILMNIAVVNKRSEKISTCLSQGQREHRRRHQDGGTGGGGRGAVTKVAVAQAHFGRFVQLVVDHVEATGPIDTGWPGTAANRQRARGHVHAPRGQAGRAVEYVLPALPVVGVRPESAAVRAAVLVARQPAAHGFRVQHGPLSVGRSCHQQRRDDGRVHWLQPGGRPRRHHRENTSWPRAYNVICVHTERFGCSGGHSQLVFRYSDAAGPGDMYMCVYTIKCIIRGERNKQNVHICVRKPEMGIL